MDVGEVEPAFTRPFLQLSGHPNSFKTAAPNTVWKKVLGTTAEPEVCKFFLVIFMRYSMVNVLIFGIAALCPR